MIKRREAAGFTLLEVLLAMAVLAVVSVGMYNTGAANIIAHQRIHDKSLAHWVALNKVVEFQYFDAFPSSGVKKYDAMQGGIEWQIQATVTATDNKNVRRVEIAVGKKPQGLKAKFKPTTDIISLIKRRS